MPLPDLTQQQPGLVVFNEVAVSLDVTAREVKMLFIRHATDDYTIEVADLSIHACYEPEGEHYGYQNLPKHSLLKATPRYYKETSTCCLFKSDENIPVRPLE